MCGLFLANGVTAQASKITDALGIGKTGALSHEKIAGGLKEALQIGTGNAVKATGRADGYFQNAAIKILMPEKMRTLEKGLRAAGQGPQVDEFILSMNRAAEKAAPLAKDIFISAIKQMTFDDARKILSGNETAATDYFRQKTTAQLTTAFTPIVQKATDEVGVTKQYKSLTAQAQSIPFLRTQALDVDQYVVGKALAGLFYMVAEEEKKIRKNPAARVTTLLKDVFGRK
jgi:hypothetical protein